MLQVEAQCGLDGCIRSGVCWSITNGAITSPSDSQSITFTAGSQGTLTLNVTVTTASGRSNECSKDITVTSWPDCSWTSNSPVCYSTPVQFNGPSGTYRYLWDFGDGSGSKDEGPSHIYRSAGTYTVKLIVVKGKISKRCQGNVVVKPLLDCR